MGNKTISPKTILNVLNACYDKAVNGWPTVKSCYDLANEYLKTSTPPRLAARKFIRWQVAKCTTSGFLTSLGGVITLPVAIPANLASVWFVQLRMIATLAVMGGYDPSDDEVQTLAYICLTGSSAAKIFREAGVQFGNKLALKMIKNIPGAALTKINQKVGLRFVTKFGTTGFINLGKMVPVAGGIIGGGVDFVGTQIIAKKAYDVFIRGEIE